MRCLTKLVIVPAALGLVCGSVWADSISPTGVSGVLGVGDSGIVRKTVTVDEGTPTTSKVDVYFLADTTGSMGGAIAGVKSSATTLLASIAGLGDVAFAVGEYKDFPRSPYGGGSDFSYRLNQAMTTSQASAQAGINLWGASGGADTPESQLDALKTLAEDPVTGWRTGSKHLLVWFGDARGHDSASEPAYPGPTEAEATAALVAAGIQVEAIDVGAMDATGQVTRIAAATGGHKYIGPNNDAIVGIIEDAITEAFTTYDTVALDISEVPAGITVTVVPGNYTGSYDRSVTRTFEFDVTFTGDAQGTYDFNIYATVDGGRVATETDSIIVRGMPDGGATLPFLVAGVMSLLGLRRRLS